jgi:hypothetical protein
MLPPIGLATVLGCAGTAPLQSEMIRAVYAPPEGSTVSIPFTYESTEVDRSRGEMVTTLGAGGAHLRGPYTRVNESTHDQLVTEIWNGFGLPEWNTWSSDGSGDWMETSAGFGEFAEFYTDKVVAYLQSDEGLKMRCQLKLNDPPQGMLQGGDGRCQLSNGGRVDLAW